MLNGGSLLWWAEAVSVSFHCTRPEGELRVRLIGTAHILRPPAAGQRRGRPVGALALVLCAQLMVILDMTIVNVALPSIERGLHFSATSLSWVLNAYALTFGGLLLLGGRAGDILGRRRVFLTGIALFTLAALAAGLATSPGWLIGARALQGVGGAIASTAALALVVSAFPEGASRKRAMGLYAGIASGGASLGLVLGGAHPPVGILALGLLHRRAGWIAVAACTPFLLTETPRRPGNSTWPGRSPRSPGWRPWSTVIRAASAGWSDRMTLAALALAIAGLAAFALTQTRAASRSRRCGCSPTANVRRPMPPGCCWWAACPEWVLRHPVPPFDPGLQPGAGRPPVLPMTILLFSVSRLAARLLGRFAPVPLALAGMVPVIAGMAWLSRISPVSGYLPGVLGPMSLFGVGMGLAMVPLTTAALAGMRAGGLGRRLQHGERHPAGRRGAGAGHPGDRVRRHRPGAGRRRAGAPSWPARMSIWCTAWRARSPSPPSSTCAPCW